MRSIQEKGLSNRQEADQEFAKKEDQAFAQSSYIHYVGTTI